MTKFKNLLDRVPFPVKYRAAKAFFRFALPVMRHFDFTNRSAFGALGRFIYRYSTPLDTRLKLAARQNRDIEILVVLDRLPIPARDSARVRMLEILRIFTKFAGVVLVLLSHKFENSSCEQSMDELGIDVIGVIDFEDILQGCHFDFVVLSYPRIAEYIMPLAKRRFPMAKIIYDTVDVQFIRLHREFLVTHSKQIGKEARRLEHTEPRLAMAADQTWCVTPDDQQFLESAAKAANIRIVPNIHKIQAAGLSFDERSGLLFIGNFEHRPNVDAVNFLLDEILPILVEEMPDLKLHIVGGDMPEKLSARQSANFTAHGFVTDVAPLFTACRVFVAPLRFGGGMKGKIGQALSFGLPVVTTGIGAEGMNLIHGHNALIADSPACFATNIMHVYHNKMAWQTLSDNGRDLIAKNLSPETVEKTIRKALNDLLPGRGISTL